tara:strand:- start:2317 stop:3483 length:1167 start_codon:yes stop_codon:yes gene_type:complete
MKNAKKDFRYPMTDTIKPLLVAALALFMAGCALAPGPHYSNSPGWFSEDDGDDAEPLSEAVEVHQISTAVLSRNQDYAAPQPPEALLQEPESYDYEVGPGDVLQITVWDHPELTIPAGSMRSSEESGNWVHNDGTIFYPYVGKIEVVGLRVTEIRDLIADRIAEYIEEPQVDVTVAAFRSQRLYVTGSVNKPGAFPITNVPTRLLDAVNAAGGITEFADWSDVTLTRDGKDYQLSLRAIYEHGNPAQNVLLEPGDVVHVGRNTDNKVFVLGEVLEPQPVPMTRNGLSLAEALSTVGGFTKQTADASGIFVMRQAPEGSDHLVDVYQLNADQATALVLADNFPLQRRDIVYVTAAPIARWNRVIQNILPTVQTIYFGALAEDRIRDPDR